MSKEIFVIPPEFASFRGATKMYGRTKCDGIIGLTENNVIFIPLVGRKIEIPINSIYSVTEEKKFLGSYRAGLSFLVLHGRELDIGFFVKDNSKWQNTLLAIIK